MSQIRVHISHNPEGKVLNVDLEYPCVTGNEGFDFLEAFQKKCGVTPRRDRPEDLRVCALIAEQEQKR